MRYEKIGKELFTENRSRLRNLLPSNSLVIIHSNDIMPTNADGTMKFRQHNQLLYFSGIDQEESILVLAPDFPDPEMREMLFLKETNEEIAIWEGHKYTKEEAVEESGISTVKWNGAFEQMLHVLMSETRNVFLSTNEHIRASIEVVTRNDRFIRWIKEKYPLHQYERLYPLASQLRSVKLQRELDMIQKACDITEAGFRRVLKFVRPGLTEYEIEAEYAHEFLRNGSRGFGYEPIVASGFNACVLHYIDNAAKCKDGDLLLMDVGAEYGNYNADMTRTIPVNGRFTKRQKDVYNAVISVMKGATSLLKPGLTIQNYHVQVGEMMEKELVDLGLLTVDQVKNQNPKSPAYKKYFMHGTSHHLGLDVHDIGNWYKPIELGNVFTVEPGIYIREENMGIRLENNVVVTEEGTFDLMRKIPLEADELEDIMNT